MISQDTRLIDRTQTHITRPVLEAAGWQCQKCSSDNDLRVIKQKGELLAICDMCRVKLHELIVVKIKKSKYKSDFEKMLDMEDITMIGKNR